MVRHFAPVITCRRKWQTQCHTPPSALSHSGLCTVTAERFVDTTACCPTRRDLPKPLEMESHESSHRTRHFTSFRHHNVDCVARARCAHTRHTLLAQHTDKTHIRRAESRIDTRCVALAFTPSTRRDLRHIGVHRAHRHATLRTRRTVALIDTGACHCSTDPHRRCRDVFYSPNP